MRIEKSTEYIEWRRKPQLRWKQAQEKSSCCFSNFWNRSKKMQWVCPCGCWAAGGQGDLLEDLERRCFNVQKDSRLAWLGWFCLLRCRLCNEDLTNPYHLLPMPGLVSTTFAWSASHWVGLQHDTLAGHGYGSRHADLQPKVCAGERTDGANGPESHVLWRSLWEVAEGLAMTGLFVNTLCISSYQFLFTIVH